MSDMQALTFDRSREVWETSTGLVKERIPLSELTDPHGVDRSSVIIEVMYAGFCGSDRGIWSRKAFGDMIHDSLDRQGKDKRVVGHELLGRIVEVGSRVTAKYRLKPGDIVSTESHIVCGTCHQCRIGAQHVCARDRIIGISMDGCFADFLKLPAKALWPTDTSRIRPEVAAVQEPFGNAVHACQAADLRGLRIAILGCGTIGLFALLIARGLGAGRIIGIEPNPKHADMARRLGCDAVIQPSLPPKDKPWASDPDLHQQVMDLTDGVGVDVALEMAGHNSSLNNALRITRRGGDIVAFGVQNGEATIENAHRVVMNGLRIHGVVGRQIFGTWEITKTLLESRSNGIADAVWDVILNRGEGTIVDIDAWEKASFEQTIRNNPKVILRFAGS